MPVDPRTDVLQAVWAIKGGAGREQAKFTSDIDMLTRYQPTSILGRLWYIHSGRGPRDKRTLREIRHDRLRAVSSRPTGSEVFGYAFKGGGSGRSPWQLISDRPQDTSRDVGYGYAGEQTDGLIHSAVYQVSHGDQVLELNLAAGGYPHSWKVGGVEILNRGDRWGRGVQQQLQWADMDLGRLTIHRPTAGTCRYDRGLAALGAPMFNALVPPTADPEGGQKLMWASTPLEWDPDGKESVPGVSTDHGGAPNMPVLWKDLGVMTELWLDYKGVVGLHRMRVAWSVPWTLITYWLPLAAHTTMFFDGAFDQLFAYDAATATEVDVTAPVDATDWRRWSCSMAGEFLDGASSPLLPPLIPSGFGAMLARNTGSDLTVGLAGRLHDIDPSSTQDSLSDILRGNQWTYSTNRTGSTGHDGDQAVMIGLDSALSGRWHNADQLRLMSAGDSVFTRWIVTGDKATALANIAQIPEFY